MLGRLLTLVMLAITWTNANAAMWLVGDPFGGWNTSGNVEMTESNGIYTYTADLTAGKGFAFFKDSQAWTSQRGPNSGDGSAPTGDWEATKSGGAWKVATSGTYEIQYNYSTDQAKIALQTSTPFDATQRKFAVTGAAFGGWNMPPTAAQTFTNNGDGTYTLEFEGATPGEFKLSSVGINDTFSSWNVFNAGCMYNGSLAEGDNTMASGTTTNMNFPVNGNVVLTISNVTATSCNLNIAVQQEIIPELTAVEIRGATDSEWNNQVTYPLTLSNGTWTLNNQVIPEYLEFKVVEYYNNNNSGVWYGAGGNGNFLVNESQLGNAIPLHGGDGYNNLYFNKAGTFSFAYTPGDNPSLTITGEFAPDTYVVAGEPESFWGSSWNGTDTNNQMTDNGDGTYTLTKSGVTLQSNTEYKFKVVKNGVDWYPADNVTFTVNESGTYDLVITYDSSNNNVTYTLTPAGTSKTFTVYVRSSDRTRAYLYAWYALTSSQSLHFNTINDGSHGLWEEVMPTENNQNNPQYGNLPDEELSDGQTWYKLTFTTTAPSYNLIAKTANGTQTADIEGITAPEVYIVYRPDGTYFYSTQGPSTIDGLYLMGLVGNQKWSANAGIELTKNNNNGTFTINNVSLVEGATFSLASRKGATTDDWEHLLPNLFYPHGNKDYLVQEKDMGVKVYLGGRGKAAYTKSNFMMEISDSYDILVDMNDMTVTFTPSFGAVYILGEISYLDLDYREKVQEWAPNVGSRMRTTDGKIYKRNLTLANGATFSFSTKLGANAEDWNSIAQYRFGAVSNGDFDVTDAMIENVQPLSLSTDGTHEAFKMVTSASKGHYIMTVDMENHTLTLKRTYVPSGEVIVHLEKTSNVNSPTLDAWFLGTHYNTENRVQENDEYETVDGRKWWSWTIDNSISDIYIYDGENLIVESGKRSGEIFFTYESGTQDEVTRNYEDLGAEGVADCATMLEGHHYVYFTNTPGWQNVYAYMWIMEPQYDDEGNPVLDDNDNQKYEAVYKKAYPGDRCTLVGYDAEGYEIWMFDLTAADYDHPTPEFIIFNDGKDPESADWQQTGNFVYHEGACYDYLSTIYLGNSLANIIAQGVVTKGPQYTVEDELVGVKVIREDTPIYDPTDGHLLRTAQYALYAKDMNNYLAPSLIEKEGQIDYMFQRSPLMQGKGRSRYDQSNWVKIVISPTMVKEGSEIEVGDAEKNVLNQYVGKVIKGGTLHANIVNNVNPEMHMLEIDTEGKTSNYPENLNVYIPASFVGTQPCVDESHNPANEYFFVAPKPQEYCEISWAVYNNTNPPIFCMPKKSFLNGHWNNEGNLSGAFLYDLTLNALNDGAENPNLVTGEAYSFKAIIRKAEAGSAQNAPRRVEQMEPKGDAALAQSTGYMVMPLNLTGSTDQIVTGIDRVDNVSQVVETRYIDLQGRVSNMPHSGVNVVVTRYSDGSTTTRKVMF